MNFETIKNNKGKIIALVVILIVLLLAISAGYYWQKPTKDKLPDAKEQIAETTSQNKIDGNQITLADGTVINIKQNTSTTSNSSGINSGTSTTNNSSGSTNSQSSGGSTQNSTSGSTNQTPAPTTPAPENKGLLWLEQEWKYPNQTITPPVNDFLLGKLFLVNNRPNDINLTEAIIAFAFAFNLDETNLNNVYLKINGQKQTIKNQVLANDNKWTLNYTMKTDEKINIEIYGNIDSGAGDIYGDSQMINLIKFTGKDIVNNQNYYSGAEGKDIFTLGQIIHAKTAQSTQPGTQPTPQPTPTPTPTPQPTSTPPTPGQPPSTSAGSLNVQNASLSQSNSFVLTGSNKNIIHFEVDATGENIDLNYIKFKISDTSNYVDISNAITKVELIDTQSNNSLSTALLNKVGNDLEANFFSSSLTQIPSGQSKKLNLRLTYGLTSGAQIRTFLQELKGLGQTSKQSISANQSSVQQVISLTNYLVSTKPILTQQQLGTPTLQGGTQRELLRFHLKAEDNANDSNANLTINNFNFTVQKTDITAKNGNLYYLSGSSFIKVPGFCYAVSQTQYNCVNIGVSLKAGKDTSFSFRADLGLKTNANIKTSIATIAEPGYVGDLAWTDKKTYKALDQPGLSISTNLSGGGNGSLYDNQPPYISSITMYDYGQAGVIEKDDYIHIQFDEEINPVSFNASIIPFADNYISNNVNGSAVVCVNGTGSVTYLMVRGVFKYVDTAFTSNDTCNKYSTKVNAYGQVIHIYIDQSGGTEAPLTSNYSSLIEDVNGNSMVAPPPFPTGSL